MKNDKTILETTEALYFEPTREQKKLKAEFYVLYNENPLVSGDTITPALITDITGNKNIGNYWRDERFKKWFLNEREYIQRAEYLFARALDELEDILELGNNEDDPIERDKIKARMAATKLQAIRLMFEITNRIPKGKDTGVDSSSIQKLIGSMISNLDTKQLKKLTEGSKSNE